MELKFTMRRERETKGTWRYTTDGEDDVAVDTLYVRKTAIKGTPPETIIVTIDWVTE